MIRNYITLKIVMQVLKKILIWVVHFYNSSYLEHVYLIARVIKARYVTKQYKNKFIMIYCFLSAY